MLRLDASTILYHAILYYTILYTILCYTILYYTILYTILYYTILSPWGTGSRPLLAPSGSLAVRRRASGESGRDAASAGVAHLPVQLHCVVLLAHTVGLHQPRAVSDVGV